MIQMATGTLIQVIPKTLYNFGYIGNDQTDNIIIARALNVIPYDYGCLWVRVYRRNIVASGSITIKATPALPSSDSQDSFLYTSETVSLALSGTPPFLAKSLLTSSNPLPPYLQIAIEADQPTTAGVLGIELSIDLHVRCCG
jgi:hypothetical protein